MKLIFFNFAIFWICMGAKLYSVWDVFNNFLLKDATERSKISSDQTRFFIALSLYPFSFFTNNPFKELFLALFGIVKLKFWGFVKTAIQIFLEYIEVKIVFFSVKENSQCIHIFIKNLRKRFSKLELSWFIHVYKCSGHV